MDWQQLVSLTIVAAAAALLVRGRFRRQPAHIHPRLPCGGGAKINPPSIVFHARRGQRPEIRVKAR